MEFSPNSTFLFIVAALVILFVIAQSVFFLVKAYKRGLAIGMDRKVLNDTIQCCFHHCSGNFHFAGSHYVIQVSGAAPSMDSYECYRGNHL